MGRVVTKVICINNSFWVDYLTIGKEYEVRQDEYSRYWLVADDLGNSFHYNKSYFEVVE